MKRTKIIKIISLFILTLVLLFPLKASAIGEDYVINNYDININVNENNTFDITETIDVYFNIPKHGIFRTIPLKNKVMRLDGTSSTNRARVTNLSVNNEYDTSREDGNLKIKIGSADDTLVGKQTYVIKYTYNLGRDHIKDYDELYYNIIGNDWDTKIEKVTFSIVMPKEFDHNKLGFAKGLFGSAESVNVNFNIVGNKITGAYNDVLNAQEGLTVRCELPEGYFVDPGLSPLIYLMFIVPIIGIGISLLLWYKYGHDEQVIETVEFYPPAGYNSLEVGFLYKGKADKQDVTSLLVYLADKGYIKIIETNEKDFKIIKLKDYDGINENEKIFLEGLFSKASDENGVKMVTSDDLSESFYVTMNKILRKINSKENKNKIFEKIASKKSIIVIMLVIISVVTLVSIPTLDYGGVEELGVTLFLCAIYVPFFAVGILSNVMLGIRIGWIVFTLLHSIVFFSSLPLIDAIVDEKLYLLAFILGVVCLIGMLFILKIMPKRTNYGNEMLGKLKGFKNFLETAEKDKLEALVMENPSYFYNILPYTYVLGVSDKWIKKFETISIESPDWYDSPNSFDVITFGHFMNSTMVSAKSAMTSVPTSDYSGGSLSGGGFSGGGSGGGGGGSW